MLRSMEARGPLPREHLGRGGNVSWDFGLFAALQLCSTLPGRPPRPPRAVLKPQHGGTGADCAVVNFGMVYGTANAVMRFQRSRREALFRLPQFHLTLHASRNSASA
jgi:hypothetical protein